MAIVYSPKMLKSILAFGTLCSSAAKVGLHLQKPNLFRLHASMVSTLMLTLLMPVLLTLLLLTLTLILGISVTIFFENMQHQSAVDGYPSANRGLMGLESECVGMCVLEWDSVHECMSW